MWLIRKNSLSVMADFLLLCFCMSLLCVEFGEVNALVLISDDFSNLEGWNLGKLEGSWSVLGGVLNGWAPENVATWVWKGDISWTDYQVTARIRLVSGSEATLIFRYIDDANFYYLGLGSWNSKYCISKVVGIDTNVIKLASTGLKSEVELNRWYTVSAIVEGNTLQMFVDGIMVLEAQDNSHPNGAVGVRLWNGTMQADYFIAETDQDRVLTPVFNPVGGDYSSPQNVELGCETVGATIRYTTDDSEPTSSSAAYSSAIVVDSTVTIKAKAFKDGMITSETASATYVIAQGSLGAPVASFTISHTNQEVNEPISFDASGSSDADGTIVSYSWDFGDGSVGSGETTSHSYNSEGTYTIVLTVVDNDDQIDEETKQVTIYSGSTPTPTETETPESTGTVTPTPTASPNVSANFPLVETVAIGGIVAVLVAAGIIFKIMKKQKKPPALARYPKSS